MRPAIVSAVIAVAVLLAPGGSAVSSTPTRNFVLRVGETVGPGSLDASNLVDPSNSLDPAKSASWAAWTIEYATCMKLVNLPDREGIQGARPVKEAAKRITVSPDGRRYTFYIRPGLRFSDRSPLTAADFADTLRRLLNPAMNSVVWQSHALDDIVGVDARRRGSTKPITGISFRGNTLTIRLTHRAPDLLARLAMPPACPLPSGYPVDSAGVDNPPPPGSGPYRITAYRPGREVVLTRNPYYRGSRPHAPTEIDVTIGGSLDHLTDAVEDGQLDYALDGPPISRLPGLRHHYKLNRRRLFVRVHPQTFYLAFNTQRRLFHNNPRLRRAIEYAIDRPAVVQAMGSPLLGTPTDHLLPPALRGSVDRRLYPIRGIRKTKAQQLARGHLNGGHAILYISSSPTALDRGVAVQRALKKIGLDVELRPWSAQVLFGRLTLPNEPYDMAIVSVEEGWPDAGGFLGSMLRARSIPSGILDPLKANYARFSNPSFEKGFRQAARRSGRSRWAAFARLEADVLRRAAPVAPLYYQNDIVFVSPRVGCVTYNPTLTIDLAAFCLR